MSAAAAFEAGVVGYMAVGALLWLLGLLAHQKRIQTGEAFSPMTIGLGLFGLIVLVSSWPLMPWKALRDDIGAAWGRMDAPGGRR